MSKRRIPLILNPQTKDLQRIQSNIIEAVDFIQLSPLTGDVSYVEGVELSTGSNVVNHKLGRKPIGYIVTDINAAVTVYRSGSFASESVALTSSGNATVSFIFF